MADAFKFRSRIFFLKPSIAMKFGHFSKLTIAKAMESDSGLTSACSLSNIWLTSSDICTGIGLGWKYEVNGEQFFISSCRILTMTAPGMTFLYLHFLHLRLLCKFRRSAKSVMMLSSARTRTACPSQRFSQACFIDIQTIQ